MKILGIETSCDETAVALVENGTTILASVVASSEVIHQKYGGVIPEKAAREQIRSIIPVLQEALENSKLKSQISKINLKVQNFIDAIAVTVAPGLIGSLLVGVETAKTLSWLWNKPIIPVNHLIAHIYANFLNEAESGKRKAEIDFPAICLIASGGHTELVLMKDHSKFFWLGGTRDDAAGECFDKCSRLLHLGYPGGPAIEKAASEVKSPFGFTQGRRQLKVKSLFKLPRPMIDDDNFDFSFSGLKTAVLQTLKTLKTQKPAIKEKNNLTESTHDRGSIRLTKEQLAYEIQEAITDVLVKKTFKAAQKYKVKSILVGGGVAANKRLREKFQSVLSNQPLGLSSGRRQPAINLFLPLPSLCTDNAACIASAAYFNYRPVPWEQVRANPSLILSS